LGNFDKAKRLDAHALCWKWCRNVTDFRWAVDEIRALAVVLSYSVGKRRYGANAKFAEGSAVQTRGHSTPPVTASAG
jgi:hypothetical protein